ncbi:putative Co-chaperone protein [Cladorrhinum sp. PSN332]|nr:putative Co-chaperone protein [Cladorrhinum sp. PSN332]
MRPSSLIPTTTTTTINSSCSSGRRRAVSSWICAACRGREATQTFSQLHHHHHRHNPSPASRATTAAAFSIATSSPSKYKNLLLRPGHALQQHHQQQQRFFSSPPSQPSPSGQSSSPRPKEQALQSTKIPQFYALFPDTLPNGPPPSGSFHIDVPTLRREFLRLQAAAHPDFHHSAQGQSAAQKSARSRAEATSALINTAFKTLSNPLTRAQYLLHELSGVDLAGDEAGDKAGKPDPELLVTVMEAREVIDEAESEEDLRGVQEENERRIEECEERLSKMFGEGDWEGAKREAVKLRYWVNIREGIRNWDGPGMGVVIHH